MTHDGGFVCFPSPSVPRNVPKPVDNVECELRFCHVPGRLVLVRQDQLNEADSLWIVDPSRDLLAQPVKPERLDLVERVSIRIDEWQL